MSAGGPAEDVRSVPEKRGEWARYVCQVLPISTEHCTEYLYALHCSDQSSAMCNTIQWHPQSTSRQVVKQLACYCDTSGINHQCYQHLANCLLNSDKQSFTSITNPSRRALYLYFTLYDRIQERLYSIA